MCDEIIKEAKGLCEKFINKVDSGKNKVETGRSIGLETYSECKSLLQKIIDREDSLKNYYIDHPTRKVDIPPSVGKTYFIYGHRSFMREDK